MKFEADTLSRLIRPDFLQAGHADEVKTLGKYEVLLQDPVTVKDVLWVRQQCFVRAETREDDAAGRQPAYLTIDCHRDVLEVLSDPQVQRAGSLGITTQMKVEAGAAQGVQRSLDQALQVDANHRTVKCLGSAYRLDLEWVNVHCRAGAEFAGHSIHGAGKQPRAFGDGLRLAERLLARRELDDRGARQRPQVVGPQQLQHGVRQLGQVVLQLEPQFGREERKGFHQALDIRVAATLA